MVTFTAKDLTNPSQQLPRAIYVALGIATTIYVAVALGVFGTLTVDEVIASGGTALAVAAEPVLGRLGYWLMSVTALFSTAGATNAGLYPAAGLCEQMASIGQFPPALGRRVGGRAPMGLLITAAAAIVLAAGFDPSSIASLGSAIALLVFTLVTAAHFRVRAETGASTLVLSVAITSTVVVLLPSRSPRWSTSPRPRSRSPSFCCSVSRSTSAGSAPATAARSRTVARTSKPPSRTDPTGGTRLHQR